MATDYELNLDIVVEIVNRHGVPAYVEQTGGGTATIYAGVPYKDDEGDQRFPAVAGPGWFTEPGWRGGRSTLYEFSIGPDDDGESGSIMPAYVGALDHDAVARLIVAQTRKPPSTLLSVDEVEALGFDGTERSLPPQMAAEHRRMEVHIAANNAENRRLIDLGVPADRRRVYADEAGRRALFDYDNPPITERMGDPAP